MKKSHAHRILLTSIATIVVAVISYFGVWEKVIALALFGALLALLWSLVGFLFSVPGLFLVVSTGIAYYNGAVSFWNFAAWEAAGITLLVAGIGWIFSRNFDEAFCEPWDNYCHRP